MEGEQEAFQKWEERLEILPNNVIAPITLASLFLKKKKFSPPLPKIVHISSYICDVYNELVIIVIRKNVLRVLLLSLNTLNKELTFPSLMKLFEASYSRSLNNMFYIDL